MTPNEDPGTTNPSAALDSPSSTTSDDDLPPLVVVEGFMSPTSAFLWGKVDDMLHGVLDEISEKGKGKDREKKKRRIIFASVGPASSLHDRACELFYALRGGTVDYGAEHAATHAHDRYGRHHKSGLYPQWSADRPLHFLGHSLGGPTITKLAHFLRTRFFGDAFTEHLILSITSVSSPHRGTPLVYTLGASHRSAPHVRPVSVGNLLTLVVHAGIYVSALDMQADQWGLGRDRIGVGGFLRELWERRWAGGRDAAPWDVTLEAAEEREARGEGETCAGIWYRSYTSCMTSRISPNSPHHHPALSLPARLLMPFAGTVGTFDYSLLRPVPSFFSRDLEERLAHPGKSEEEKDGMGEVYWANDGIVPLYSQWHPGDCSSSHCSHSPPLSLPPSPSPAHTSQSEQPQPGKWHVTPLDGAHHISLVPVWVGSEAQRWFWGDLGAWLERVEEGWKASGEGKGCRHTEKVRVEG